MNVLVVSGIWPPDVGGPASHAPELAAHLLQQGDRVSALITADRAPSPAAFPIHWVSRRIPTGLRHAAVAAAIARHARGHDVVYATSMLGRAALGARAARRPLVVKLVADEAYERAKRLGLYTGTLADFQHHHGGPAVGALRLARNRSLRLVDQLVCPSSYLAELAVTWGVPERRVSVLPNPAPPLPVLRSREELRDKLGIAGPLAAFAGRLTAQKALETAFAALRGVPDLTLVVAGDGPDRERFEAAARALGVSDRVRFVGALDRVGVLELFRAADVSVLSSAWENFPHTVVEALAVGTPVVATAAGGVAEVVRDGENGLLVAPGDSDALAGALRRFFDDPELRRRLQANAAASVESLSTASIYGRLRAILAAAAR